MTSVKLEGVAKSSDNQQVHYVASDPKASFCSDLPVLTVEYPWRGPTRQAGSGKWPPHARATAPHRCVAVLEAVPQVPRRMPRHSAPRLPAPSLRPTPRRWACGRCLTAATRPLLRSGYSRWGGAIIASRSVRRAELRRDARGLPAWPFERAVEDFFCTDPVWLGSVPTAWLHGCMQPY